MNTLANFDNPLPHIWPKGGVWGLQPFHQGHYSIGCTQYVRGYSTACLSLHLHT